MSNTPKADTVRIGSLFSGTGMLDHGVQQFFDAEVAFFAEFEPPTKDKKTGKLRPGTQAPARILAKHFPDAPNLGDVSKVNWSLWFGLIEILSGGFPCQDVSLAGARAGITVDSRSGMWQHYALAISIIRPSLVIIENVRGLLSAKAGDHDEITDDEGWTDDEIAQLEAEYPTGGGAADRGMESGAPVLGEPTRDGRPVLNAFGSVLGDLAELGYVAVWTGVQASDAGAPHARFRVFIVARPADDNRSRDWPRAAENSDRATRGQWREPATVEATGGGHGPTLADELEHGFDRPVPDDPSNGRGEGWPEPTRLKGGSDAELSDRTVADPAHVGHERGGVHGDGGLDLRTTTILLPTPVANDSGNSVEAHLRKKPGRTQVTSLQIIAEHVLPVVNREDMLPILPTPQVADAEGGHRSRSGDRSGDRSGEKLLPGVVELFPTPSTSNANGNQTNNRGDLLPGVAESLPSPRLLRGSVAAEGTKATTRQGVDQKSESGQVWLTNEVHDLPTPDKQPGGIDLIPTPTSRDWKDGAENANVPINGLLGRTVWDSELPDGAPENSVEAYEQLWDSLDDQSPFWKTEKADYWPAIARWALIMGRAAPAPTVPDGKGGRFRLSAKFAEWMMGMPAGWVTDCGLTRNEELKACGNGVVHQQASLALHVLMPMLWAVAA